MNRVLAPLQARTREVLPDEDVVVFAKDFCAAGGAGGPQAPLDQVVNPWKQQVDPDLVDLMATNTASILCPHPARGFTDLLLGLPPPPLPPLPRPERG